ncbi:hypothetical protein [Flavobacterium sp. WC2430]|uniref:hypothetical protein n=1 Tax=Flavobacterium sp. WC2430 TaxID=3234137 RepID=UPI003466D651
MKKTKQLGIWMDHSLAYLMEFTTKPFEIQTIIHEFHLEDKATSKLEKKTSIKNVYGYYNRIAEAIINYDKIILFGPSNTKVDFFDILSEDERFVKMKIEIKETDTMNVNQQHAFINEYFVP